MTPRKLYDFNFVGGTNDPDFLPFQQRQQELFSEEDQLMLMNYSFIMSDNFRPLNGLLQKQEILNISEIQGSEKYRLPYLTLRQFMTWEMLTNLEVYNDARRWLQFDETACCKKVPYPDEVVFHFRNFMHEMKRDGVSKYAEVTPSSLANFVFRDYLPGTRVAILSRFEHGLQPYIDALESKNFSVRSITNQTGVEDFCFLMKAKKELVGFHWTTFFRWASFLSDVANVRFYRLDQSMNRSHSLSPARRVWTRKQGGRSFVVEEYWQPVMA